MPTDTYKWTDERRIDKHRVLGTQIREELEAHFAAGNGFKSGTLPIMSVGWSDEGRVVTLPYSSADMSIHIGRLRIYLEDHDGFDNIWDLKSHLATLTQEVYSWMEGVKPN